MAMPFDTLKLARRLEAAGFPAQQAGDMSDAIAEAISNLATKDDVRHLEARLTVLMWAVGINSALTVAILGVLLRVGGHVP